MRNRPCKVWYFLFLWGWGGVLSKRCTVSSVRTFEAIASLLGLLLFSSGSECKTLKVTMEKVKYLAVDDGFRIQTALTALVLGYSLLPLSFVTPRRSLQVVMGPVPCFCPQMGPTNDPRDKKLR